MINRYEPHFDFADEKHEQKRTPAYEIIKTLTPILLVVFGYLGKMSRPFSYGFACLAVLGIYYDPLTKALRWVRMTLHNRAVARGNIKQLRHLSEELTTFLDITINRSDGLQAIVNAISQRSVDLTRNVRLPVADIFHYQGYYLNKRIHEHLSVKHFHDAVTEFYGLVSGYNSFAVSPVFQTLAHEHLLNAHEKSQLNAFQQRWVAFIADYQKFAKELNREFRSRASVSIEIGPPLPLS